MSNERSLAIILDFSDSYKSISHGHDPYPNVIKNYEPNKVCL